MSVPQLHSHKFERDRQLSLKILLIVPFVIQVIAAVGITGWLSVQNGREATQELAPQIGQEVTNTIETHVRSYFDAPLEILQAHGVSASAGYLSFENLESLDKLFWQQMRQAQNLYFFYAANPQGKFIGVERKETQTLLLHRTLASNLRLQKSIYRLDNAGKIINQIALNVYDPRDRLWYREAVKTRQIVWSPIYLFASRPILGITASLPIYNQSGNLRGVLAIDLTLSQIGEFLKQLKISKTGQAFILEPSGAIVATSTSEAAYISTNQGQQRIYANQSQNPLLRLAFQNLNQRYPNLANVLDRQQIQIEWQGGTQYVQITRLRSAQGLDWLLIVAVSEQDFRDRIDINTRNTIVLCALALVFASLTGFYTSRWIAKPVEKLIEASRLLSTLTASADIASGQTYRPIETANVRELSILADSFNQMAQQLQTSFIALAQSKDELEKRVEWRTEALKSSEIKYRTLVEASNCIILRRDHIGTIKFINEYGLDFFGFVPEDEVIGKNIVGTIIQSNDDPISSKLLSWMNNGDYNPELYMFQESQNIRHDGEQVWISWSNRPILDESGNLVEILSIGIDITERKRVESTLEEFLSLQRATLESIADGILAVDRIGHITSYNRQFVDMFLLSNEVLSMPDYALRLEFLAEQMLDPQDFMQRSRDFYHHPELESYSLPSVELYTKARIIDEQGRAIKSNKL
jgi:PAS domain S-box-containing protein